MTPEETKATVPERLERRYPGAREIAQGRRGFECSLLDRNTGALQRAEDFPPRWWQAADGREADERVNPDRSTGERSRDRLQPIWNPGRCLLRGCVQFHE